MKTLTRPIFPMTADRIKHRQSGVSLIEVLVAMFVLSIGVLALLSIQLKTVSAVRESEHQTAVAQAAQNLIEGMLSNPVFEEGVEEVQITATMPDGTVVSAPASNGRKLPHLKKSYQHYISYNEPKTDGYTADMSKQELANLQVKEFNDEITTATPGSRSLFWTICQDSSGKPMTYSGTDSTSDLKSYNDNCDYAANADHILKIIWLEDAEEKGSNTPNGLKTTDNAVVYTYEAYIKN